MRELLTGLAIVVIVALTAALVGPYLVDWNGQRAFIEARLSEVLGQRVTIGGNIDVKLLPTPYLVLGQTVIGDDEAPVRLSIHHLDLELSVTPLLHGEIDVTQARLVEPTIRVTLTPDRTLPALPDAPAFHADVSLDHLAVTGGTLAIADPLSGRTFVLDNLELEADAASLAGPFKVAGTEGPEGSPTSFRLSTAAAHDGRAHVRLLVAGNADHAGLDLDGTLALSSGGRSSVRQSFTGRVAIAGKLDQSDGAPVAWTLSGPLQADPSKATLDGGELRLGGEDKGLTLAAAGSADLGASPHIDLDLSADTLDLDRLSGAPTDPTKSSPPPQLPPLATIRHALVAATPPLPTRIDAKVETATWAGETLADLAAHVEVGGTGPQPFALEGKGPGSAHLKVDGTLGPSGFAGRVAFSAERPARTAAWVAAIDSASPIKADYLPAAPLAASATVAVGTGKVDASDLTLALGRSTFTGTARLDPPAGEAPARLEARLSSAGVSLDTLPDIARWRRPGRALDLDLALDARTLQIAEAGEGALSSGPIKLAITKTGPHLALTSFSAERLGGATITAEGTLDPRAAQLSLKVDAAKLDAAAKLARQLAPGELADALYRRAPTLAPAKIKLDAEWAMNAAGTLTPTHVALDGTLGASVLHAALAPDSASPEDVGLEAELKAPEGTALLQQLGIAALPVDTLGASRVALEAHGNAGAPLDTKLAVALGATTLELSGQFKMLGAPRGGSGSLVVHSPDVSPLLRSFAFAFPDMTSALPAQATSTLAWGTAGLGLTDVKADVAGTRATGTLRYEPGSYRGAAITGALDLDRLSLATLTGLAFGPEQPAAPDSLWSNLAFASGLADAPRTDLQLGAKTLDIVDGLSAHDAALDLAVTPGTLTLKSIAAELAGGRVTGSASLRRDGPRAGLESVLGLDGVALDTPAVRGRLAGKLDLAGSGTSPLALVASLAGSGEATVTDLSIAGADPAALPKLFADVESDALAVDADTVARSYADAAVGALAAGTRRFDLLLAGGTLAFSPEPNEPDATPVASHVEATLDLRRPSLALRARETLRALPEGWSGAAPALVVAWSGPLRAPQRSIDVGAFINAVAARALSRETARIEAYEQDIRERALFNARLQTERRRTLDKAEAEARRLAAAKAAQEKAARDKAEQNRAIEERAAQEPAPRELSPPAPDRGHPAELPDSTPERSGSPGDPSAAGRY